MHLLFIEYNYSNGKRHGIQKRWHPNGRLSILYNYNLGKLNGEQKSWYSNGQLKTLINYNNDVLHGTHKEWFQDGRIKISQIYKISDFLKSLYLLQSLRGSLSQYFHMKT